MIKTSRGFTLIELIVVITILGFLTLFAAPRFLNLQDDAKNSVTESIASSFEVSLAIARAKWVVVGGKNTEQANVVGDLDFNDVGYPIGTDKATAEEGGMSKPYNIGRTNEGCANIFRSLMDTSYVVHSYDSDLKADIYTKREEISFIDDGAQVSALSQCKYVLDKKENFDSSIHDFYYNSRTGQVTH